MRIKKLISLFVFFVGFVPLINIYASITKGPWINNVQTNSAVIMWETSTLPSANYVEYGLTTAYGSVSSNSIDYNVITTYYIHEVKITNLTGNATFHYKIHSDGDSSVDGWFKTPPPPGTDMNIVIFGDNRGDDHNPWKQVCTTVNSLDPDLLVHVGDYVMTGDIYADWNTYFFIQGSSVSTLLRTHSFIGVPGNHEVANTWGGHISDENNTLYYHYFSTPTHPENNDPPEAYYSYIWGDIHFIMADVNDENQVDFRIGSPQYNWIENELFNNNSKWVFYVEHTPIISASYHGQWTSAAQGSLMPLFENYVKAGGRILEFNGDDHNWQLLKKDGVHYCVTGGSGADLYDFSYNPSAYKYAIVTNEAFSFTYLQITNNANNIYLQAKLADGTTFYATNFEYSKMTLYQSTNIVITEPDGIADSAYNLFTIKYRVESPFPLDASSEASLYYTHTSNDNNYQLITTQKCQKYILNYQYNWDTSQMSSGRYYITGILTTPNNKKFTNKSPFPLTVGSSNAMSFQAYPTPFVPGKNILRIRYTVPADKTVSFIIYDLLGRQVRSITEATSFGFSWDGKDDLGEVVPKGVYIVKMKVGKRIQKSFQKVVVK